MSIILKQIKEGVNFMDDEEIVLTEDGKTKAFDVENQNIEELRNYTEDKLEGGEA